MEMKKSQISDLLRAQSVLNDAYVKGWRDELELEHFKSALLCEFAEFLESTPRFGINTSKFTGWKWWKTYLKDDVQNSKVEIVDILHFGLSYHMLARYKENGLYTNPEDFDNSEFIKDYEQINTDAFKDNLLKEAYFALDVFLSTADLRSLFYFLDVLASYHNMNMYDVYKGYFLKNELNLQRIKNGYLDGTYEKVDSNGNEDNRKLEI